MTTDHTNTNNATGHDHLCRDCGAVVGHGDGDTCEVDADHDWSLCDQCAAKSHPIRPAQ